MTDLGNDIGRNTHLNKDKSKNNPAVLSDEKCDGNNFGDKNKVDKTDLLEKERFKLKDGDGKSSDKKNKKKVVKFLRLDLCPKTLHKRGKSITVERVPETNVTATRESSEIARSSTNAIHERQTKSQRKRRKTRVPRMLPPTLLLIAGMFVIVVVGVVIGRLSTLGEESSQQKADRLKKSIEKTKKEIVEAKKEQKRLKDYKYKIQEFVEKKYFINTYFYNSKTYSISTETESVNVTEFEEICFLLDGKLVEIEDKVVMNFVNNIITHSRIHNKVFIGLEFVNGEWKYPSDRSTKAFKDFNNTEPDDPQKACVYVYRRKMFASSCLDSSGEIVHYVCENESR